MVCIPSKLSVPQGDLAQSILKDPYDFNFLTMTAGYNEHELEEALVNNITPLSAGTWKRLCICGSSDGVADAQWQVLFPGFDILSHPHEVLCGGRVESCGLHSGVCG